MDRDERIRERAYNIWCACGWPKGRDLEHWEQACREIESGDDNHAAAAAMTGVAPQPTGAESQLGKKDRRFEPRT